MDRTESGTQTYLAALADRLVTAPHGYKGELVAQAATFLGVSPDKVYRDLRALGRLPKRKPRADRGASKLPAAQARTVASLMVESSRANGKRLMPQRDALEIAAANGIVTAPVSVSTLSRRMRAEGFHPDQIARPTPHTKLRSLHPNHVWQLDVSVCVLFYLDGKAGLSVMDERRFYKNKPQNVARIAKQRVLRYLVTDHFTGAFYLDYYLGAGESQEILFDFLMEAFNQRTSPQDPFHGVPFLMVWDAGSANQSHLIDNLLDRLQVKHWAHIPGNPRAKGQVETTHNLVERGFEGRLSLMQVEDIDQLTDSAHVWMRHFNASRAHSRHGNSRYGLWQTIRPEQLRLCPPRELCEQLLRTRPEQRKVQGDLTVQYTVKGYPAANYSVAEVPGVRIGEPMKVCVNPYRAPNLFVLTTDQNGQEVAHECIPLQRDQAGFYESAPVIGERFAAPPDTDTDRHRKAMAKAAYGAETQQAVDEARKQHRPAFGGQIDPISYLAVGTVAHFMNRPGSQLEIPNSSRLELKPLEHLEALKRLRAHLGRPLTQEENRKVREAYPEGVPETDFANLVDWLSSADPSAAARSAKPL